MTNTLFDQLYVELKGCWGRNISRVVQVDQLVLPVTSEEQHCSWVDALLDNNPLANPGDVYLSMVPPPPEIEAVLARWAAAAGLTSATTHSAPRLLACEGSWFHNDVDQAEYPESAFSVLWLEDESPWDLVFPLSGLRIPLSRGTHVLFDAGNIHGVVPRGASQYVEEDFYEPGFQMFFSTAYQYSSGVLQAKMGVEVHPKNFWKGRRSIADICGSSKLYDPSTGTISM